jgi:hypothetical protein
VLSSMQHMTELWLTVPEGGEGWMWIRDALVGASPALVQLLFKGDVQEGCRSGGLHKRPRFSAGAAGTPLGDVNVREPANLDHGSSQAERPLARDEALRRAAEVSDSGKRLDLREALDAVGVSRFTQLESLVISGAGVPEVGLDESLPRTLELRDGVSVFHPRAALSGFELRGCIACDDEHPDNMMQVYELCRARPGPD